MSQERLPPSNASLLMPSSREALRTPADSSGGQEQDLAAKAAALTAEKMPEIKAKMQEAGSRAGEQVQALAGKAAALAAEKMPEIKTKVRDMSAKVGQIAGSAIDQTGQALKDSEKRSSMINAYGKKAGVAVGGLVVLGIVGWFVAGHVASSRAKDAVDGFLIRNNLQGAVSYGDVSATPFGKVTLSRLQVMLPGFSQPLKIDRVSVSDLDSNAPWKGGKVAIKSAQFPVLAMAQNRPFIYALRGSLLGNAPIALISEAVELGYTDLLLDTSLAWNSDDKQRTLSATSTGEIQDAASWKIKLDLAGVDASALAGLYGARQTAGGNPLAALAQSTQILSTLAGVSLSQADISIDNADWAKRGRLFPDVAIPDEGAAAHAQSGLSEVALVKSGMGPADARTAAAAADAWVQKGGSLRVTTHLDRPVPLVRPASNWFLGMPIPAFDSIPAFLAATKSTISN